MANLPMSKWACGSPIPFLATLPLHRAQAAPSLDQHRLNAISLDLDIMQQTVDRIAVTQEQTTRNVEKLTASQELQAVGQYILYKNSEPPPPQLSAPAATTRSSQARMAR